MNGKPTPGPLRVPVRDLESAVSLVGEPGAIELLARLLNAKEVAKLWGVSEDFVEVLGRSGQLPRVTMGRRVRYRLLDVLKCIETNSGK